MNYYKTIHTETRLPSDMEGLTMLTHYYKGFYINGRCDCDACSITDDTGHFIGRTFKSYRAAQIAITKFIKNIY